MPNTEQILSRLASQGYRLTGPRKQVLDEVLCRTEPFTSAELWEAIQHNCPSLGRATLFRTLDLLTQLGIVQRLHSDANSGRCHAYLACDERHHHHLICNSCGRVADFLDNRALDTFLHDIEKRTAFQVEGHRLELTGVCPDCRHKQENI